MKEDSGLEPEPSAEPPPVYERRFEMDAVAELSSGKLRLFAAALVVIAIGWMLTAGPGALGYALAFIGGLVSIGWVFAYRRAVARSRMGLSYFLDLAPDALLLAEGEVRHHIDWAEVTDVEIDEEKLVVSVSRRGAPPLRIQPRYRGVSLEELGEAVRRAWLDAAPEEKC